jgi:hemin uptake protein HemP
LAVISHKNATVVIGRFFSTRFRRLFLSMSEPQPDRPTTGPTPDPAQQQDASLLPKIVSFREISRCGDEVWIDNDGQLYRLRKTRQGKLILTK